MSEQPERAAAPDDYADREVDALDATEAAILDADIPVADAQEQRIEVADPEDDEYR